jgi:hypothetical protein
MGRPAAKVESRHSQRYGDGRLPVTYCRVETRVTCRKQTPATRSTRHLTTRSGSSSPVSGVRWTPPESRHRTRATNARRLRPGGVRGRSRGARNHRSTGFLIDTPAIRIRFNPLKTKQNILSNRHSVRGVNLHTNGAVRTPLRMREIETRILVIPQCRERWEVVPLRARGSGAAAGAGGAWRRGPSARSLP